MERLCRVAGGWANGRHTVVLVLVLLLFAVPSHAVRIKDIVDVRGVRSNQLVGYGLIVGLDGTGDGKKSLFTVQSLASMLEKMGVSVNPSLLAVNNVAAVMVTAVLPPFARAGSRLDAMVSSIGDAKNLQGGTLLMTPLRAANGSVYAVAQGPVSTGGFQAGGAGAGVQKNFPTVGRVVSGAVIEKEVATAFNQKSTISLALHHPDFTTASRVAQAINAAFVGGVARTPDAGTVEVTVPPAYAGRIVALVTEIERLTVTPDNAARVVINERTGTVVIGENVRLATIAIAHGNLSIEIKETPEVSQPLPLSPQGETVVTTDTQLEVTEEGGRLFLVKEGVSIGKVVRALNALGVTPRDLIAILQAIKAAGALPAELEIM
jgi:flagellar P-ring protein precursor FlgI